MDTPGLRVCTRCHVGQHNTDYYTYINRGKKYLNTICKECTKAYQLEYRQNLGRKWNESCTTRRQTKKDRAVKLLGGKCVDCDGIFPSYVYDFHHPDQTQKEGSPTRLFHRKWDESVENELKSLILLCANCHRGRHFG